MTQQEEIDLYFNILEIVKGFKEKTEIQSEKFSEWFLNKNKVNSIEIFKRIIARSIDAATKVSERFSNGIKHSDRNFQIQLFKAVTVFHHSLGDEIKTVDDFIIQVDNNKIPRSKFNQRQIIKSFKDITLSAYEPLKKILLDLDTLTLETEHSDSGTRTTKDDAILSTSNATVDNESEGEGIGSMAIGSSLVVGSDAAEDSSEVKNEDNDGRVEVDFDSTLISLKQAEIISDSQTVADGYVEAIEKAIEKTGNWFEINTDYKKVFWFEIQVSISSAKLFANSFGLNNIKVPYDEWKKNVEEMMDRFLEVLRPIVGFTWNWGKNLDAESSSNIKLFQGIAEETVEKLYNILRVLREINDDSKEKINNSTKNSSGGSPLKQSPEVKSKFISDAYDTSEDDVLGYDLIADNLFHILADKATNPPLNVGIMAPWGRGKTSLMRRVQKKFDETRKEAMNETGTPREAKEDTPSNLSKSQLTRFREWFYNLFKGRNGVSLQTLKLWLDDDSTMYVRKPVPYATVWFNPWNYQSSDMIWAGLANAVIEQTVEQMEDTATRETFWLQLYLSRIDKNELRRDIQKRAILFVSQLLMWGLAGLGLVLYLFYHNLTGGSMLGIGAVGGIITSIGSRIKSLSKVVTEAYDKYSKAPQYTKNLGSFHEVHADLDRVFDLCIDKEKPMVIFVDDLDRCSPSKVVEVVEAINVFISGRFNTKCYFILGMDAEMVAAALDVSYEKMKGKMGSKELEQGSIGWYFLDKFIQMPFFIPVMSEKKKTEFLQNLMSDEEKQKNQKGAEKEKPVINEKKVENTFKEVMSKEKPEESEEVIIKSGLTEEEKVELNKAILKNQVESPKQNEAIKEQVLKYAPYLNSDPRSLKRFANLLRFYCSYQFVRMKNNQDYVEADVLSKWLAIMVKFPQMLRWVQWDAENKSGMNTTAEGKLKIMDELVNKFLEKINRLDDDEINFNKWHDTDLPKEFLSDDEPKKIREYKDMPWLKSRGMYRILISDTSDKAKFINALDCNVW